jgi:hypothetical protein
VIAIAYCLAIALFASPILVALWASMTPQESWVE